MSAGVLLKPNDTIAPACSLPNPATGGQHVPVKIRCRDSQGYHLPRKAGRGLQVHQVVLAVQPRIIVAAQALAQTYGVTFSSHRQLGNHDQAARQFAAMIEVLTRDAAVYAKLTEDVLDLWTLIKARDQGLERAIAERICELMRAYPHLDFDFMILEEDTPAAATVGESGFALVAPE